MIVACPACDSRYDATGRALGDTLACRCGQPIPLAAPSPQAGQLTCPRCGAGVSPHAPACAHCTQPLLLKACPRCLSRVFHGHKHCPACGGELSLAAHVETATPRPCPRCDIPLAARRIEDVIVDECLTCHGVFLDHVAIQRIVTERRQARAEALAGALPAPERPGLPPAGRMYIKCPLCRVVMNRKQFATGAGVVVDVCRTHGTFFDAGELPRIIEYVMQGGLERSERRDLERIRVDAQRARSNAQFTTMMAARSSTHARHQDEAATRGGAFVELLSHLFR